MSYTRRWLAATCLWLAITCPVLAAEQPHPNVLLILVDDMGIGDPGCYNPDSKIPTPHIDRLANEGLRFTDAHAPGSVCIPSRYGLLTGRYPSRIDWSDEVLIEPGRTTIASLLTEHGYQTWCIGKWHLGLESWRNPPTDRPLRGGPVDQGFARYFGLPASLDIPPYYYIEQDRPVALPTLDIAANNSPDVRPIQGAFWRAGKIAPGFQHEQVLSNLTQHAVDLLDQHQRQSAPSPFFLYVALTAPHTPWLPSSKFSDASRAGDYGNFATEVDAQVGRLLDELAQRNLHDDTLVIFTSDNGPVWFAEDVARYDHRSSYIYRGMKGDAWEGGHRMPFIARWPGHAPAGTTCDEIICFTDILATLADIIHADLPPSAGEDSYSLLPLLQGQTLDQPLREVTLHQTSSRTVAIRQGPWKFIPQLGSGGFSEPRKEKPQPNGPQGQLYHLQDDPAETNNLYAQHPDIVARLSQILEQYPQPASTPRRP